ncbi:MAG: copper chaperone PCu(A)C [Xanthomonadales bacterium]|nr:copper chaperone PCu(A)C [Xanthomonadales bacterium]
MRHLAIVLLGLLVSMSAARADTRIEVRDAWIRQAPPGAMMLAAYAELANTGDQTVRIAQAGSAAFGVVEIHRTIEEDGISRMRPAGVLEMAPGDAIRLAPGGLHLMLMQPRSDLKAGETVVIDLLTEDGDIIPGVFKVRAPD